MIDSTGIVCIKKHTFFLSYSMLNIYLRNSGIGLETGSPSGQKITKLALGKRKNITFNSNQVLLIDFCIFMYRQRTIFVRTTHMTCEYVY